MYTTLKFDIPTRANYNMQCTFTQLTLPENTCYMHVHCMVFADSNQVLYCIFSSAYHKWMKDNGGSIVNIIVDMVTGFPGMA